MAEENKTKEQAVNFNQVRDLLTGPLIEALIKDPAASFKVGNDGSFGMNYKPLADMPAPSGIPQGVIDSQAIQMMAENQLAGQSQIRDMIGTLAQRDYQKAAAAQMNDQPRQQAMQNLFRMALQAMTGDQSLAQIAEQQKGAEALKAIPQAITPERADYFSAAADESRAKADYYKSGGAKKATNCSDWVRFSSG